MPFSNIKLYRSFLTGGATDAQSVAWFTIGVVCQWCVRTLGEVVFASIIAADLFSVRLAGCLAVRIGVVSHGPLSARKGNARQLVCSLCMSPGGLP